MGVQPLEIDLPHGRLFAQTCGSGVPILILHGGGLDHRHMLDAVEPVFDSMTGWRRVYLDLPGHGRSEVDDSIGSQDDVLQLISEFADTAFGGQAFAVIGESRGSYHAMGLVHTRAKDILGMMLIVADGMPGQTVNWRPMHQTLVSTAKHVAQNATPDAAARFERLVVQTPEILSKIEKTKVPASPLADQALAERLKGNFAFSFNLNAPIAPFEKPGLIVNGRQDAMAGYRDMMDVFEHYPRATLAVLDRAGHSVAWEQPDVFKALTLDWLDRTAHAMVPAE